MLCLSCAAWAWCAGKCVCMCVSVGVRVCVCVCVFEGRVCGGGCAGVWGREWKWWYSCDVCKKGEGARAHVCVCVCVCEFRVCV